MKLKVFSVYDAKAFAYLPPFFIAEKGMAARAFSEAVENPQHQFGKHPEDFTLFYLGEFDDQTGYFEGQVAPEVVTTALAVRRRVSEDAALTLIGDELDKE